MKDRDIYVRKTGFTLLTTIDSCQIANVCLRMYIHCRLHENKIHKKRGKTLMERIIEIQRAAVRRHIYFMYTQIGTFTYFFSKIV